MYIAYGKDQGGKSFAVRPMVYKVRQELIREDGKERAHSPEAPLREDITNAVLTRFEFRFEAQGRRYRSPTSPECQIVLPPRTLMGVVLLCCLLQTYFLWVRLS